MSPRRVFVRLRKRQCKLANTLCVRHVLYFHRFVGNRTGYATRDSLNGRRDGSQHTRRHDLHYEVASSQLARVDPQQDFGGALRMIAKHQVGRLPLVEEGGRLVGIVVQADIAREGHDAATGRLVQEISY